VIDLDTIICGDCLEVMRGMPDNSVDLTVTSPPYDNLRKYNGYTFDFEGIARELFRVTKQGGVVVWVVGDATINGSETGTSFRQALYFKEIGFNLHDTMIYRKKNPVPINSKTRYNPCFEYMFILSSGQVLKANVNQVPTQNAGKSYRVHRDNNTSNGGGAIGTKDKVYITKDTRNEDNIWTISPVGGNEYEGHPAAFPESLSGKHILSWSNEGDVVLDPMCGSGTTCKMAALYKRKFIGIDISEEYCNIARRRVSAAVQQLGMGL